MKMNVKNKTSLLLIAILLATSVFSCKKKKGSNEDVVVSTPQFQSGHLISNTHLTGTVKGTMETGKTYYFDSQVTINAGDTVVMQEGVKLLATNPAAQLIVKGTFISLGSKDAPNFITGQSMVNTPKPSGTLDPNSDPAFTPLWGGIQCDTSCKLLVIKWTHLDYSGGNWGSNPLLGYAAGSDMFTILFQNPNGIFVLEDSWIYGSTTDGARIKGGKISIMRNTFEKCAYNDGEAINVKSGTVGDMAYNMIIGPAKNGLKASNKGGLNQTNVTMYNNTCVNGGFRSIDANRGACYNYEEGAEGLAYNNIVVNCRVGLRIVGNPAADTINMHYGYTLNYGDSASVVNQFYPVGYKSHAMSTDIPTPSTFLPVNYQPGMAYTPSINLLEANDPKFVNFPLPQSAPHLRDINSIGNYNFRLLSGSPAIGKGYTSFSPINSVSSLQNQFLKATITPPSSDIGAYPTNGNGNKH